MTSSPKARYEYIVVGSGAGGGTVAARLAEAGRKVLVLEAGGDPEDLEGGRRWEPHKNTMPDDYEVPIFHGRSTENEAMRWDFWCRHYDDQDRQRRDPNYRSHDPDGKPVDGVLYPRAGTLGGCTAHNAMIMVYPHNRDWDELAELTGDPSWAADNMRKYFERMEDCRYRNFPIPWRWIYKLFRWNPGRHGFAGWLATEIALPWRALKRDWRLIKTILKSIKAALKEVEEPWNRIRWFFRGRADSNDWRLVQEDAVGIRIPALSTRRHARTGTREFLRDVEKRCPENLTIELDALVTRVLFEEGTHRAIGVEYRKGKRLYRAFAKPSEDEGEPRQAFASREVILAGGAFNTPQLLMLSGIGPRGDLERRGIRVRVPLEGVGKNLQDRYEVGVVSRMKKDWRVLEGAELEPGDRHHRKWAKKRSGLYTSNGAVLAVIKRSDPNQKGKLPDLFCFAAPGRFDGYRPEWSREALQEHNYLTWVVLKAHTENRAGTVTLDPDPQRARDPRNPPRINFAYFEEGSDARQEDLAGVVAGVEFVRKLADRVPALEEVLPGRSKSTRGELEQFVKDHAWGHHASCTCKIGTDDDPDAVLDGDFRVRGTRGLRVVDASVFPRIPGFFIVTSVYMVGEKAADVILADAARRPEPEPAKNIVLCSDGTGNSAGKGGEGTNVRKIFRAVELRRENDESREQLAFYDDGVGTGSLKIVKALGGAFGWGLSRNIRDLYSYLVHHYNPGDRIFLFGFSRGAFTVRSLGGLICSVGIVDRTQEALRPRLKWDWLLFWRLFKVGKPWPLEERIEEAFKTYRRAFRKAPAETDEPQTDFQWQRRSYYLQQARSLTHEFQRRFCWEIPPEHRRPGCVFPHDVPIECIGVWDTVDAVGLPVDELTEALNKVFRFRFHRHGLHRCVARGYQALAIDDERHTFHPLLWDESVKAEHQTIEQVWFAGAHSNVGGGYAKDEMALVALDWMMRKVAYAEADVQGGRSQVDPRRGIHFRRDLWEEWRQEANADGTLYDSRRGPLAYYRYRPRNLHELSVENQRLRKVPGRPLPKVHSSVLQRIVKGTDDYAPVNLPAEFEVAEPPDGGAQAVQSAPAAGAGAGASEPWWEVFGRLAGKDPQAAHKGWQERFWKALDPAWDTIWLRRVLYFAFVVLSLLLVYKGWRLTPDPEECCEVSWGFFDPLFDVAAWAAPALVEGWIWGFRNNPIWLLFFIVAAVLMLWFRGRVTRRTRDVGLAAWKLARGEHVDAPQRNWREKAAHGIRGSTFAGGWRRIARKVLPWAVLIAGFAGLGWLLWWISTPPAPKVPTTECRAQGEGRPLAPGEERVFLFETSCPGYATDVLLEAGARYRFGVEARREGPQGLAGQDPALDVWCDASYAASPDGLVPRRRGSECPATIEVSRDRAPRKYWGRPTDAPAFVLSKVFRRSWKHDWFVLLGAAGTGDDYVFEVGSGLDELVSAETGRLHFWVNDAVCYVCPSGPWALYENNSGTARITVKRLDGG